MPNNRGGDQNNLVQDKLQINFEVVGKWDDLASNKRRPFICQKQSGML